MSPEPLRLTSLERHGFLLANKMKKRPAPPPIASEEAAELYVDELVDGGGRWLCPEEGLTVLELAVILDRSGSVSGSVRSGQSEDYLERSHSQSESFRRYRLFRSA